MIIGWVVTPHCQKTNHGVNFTFGDAHEGYFNCFFFFVTAQHWLTRQQCKKYSSVIGDLPLQFLIDHKWPLVLRIKYWTLRFEWPTYFCTSVSHRRWCIKLFSEHGFHKIIVSLCFIFNFHFKKKITYEEVSHQKYC